MLVEHNAGYVFMQH